MTTIHPPPPRVRVRARGSIQGGVRTDPGEGQSVFPSSVCPIFFGQVFAEKEFLLIPAKNGGIMAPMLLSVSLDVDVDLLEGKLFGRSRNEDAV